MTWMDGVRCRTSRTLLLLLLTGCVVGGGGVVFAKDATSQPRSSAQVMEQARLLETSNRYAEAVDLYRSYLRTHPDDDTIRAAMARVLAWQGKQAEAVSLYQEVLSRHPADHDSRAGLARVLAWQKRWRAAQAHYERVLREAPTHVEALIGLGDVFRWSGHPEQALAPYERAWRLEERADLATRLREVQAELAAPAVSRQEVERLLAEGRQQETTHQWPAAAEAYRRALVLDPGNDDIRTALARMLSRQGALAESESLYRELLGRHPEDQEVRLALARVLSWERQFSESAQLYEQVLTEEPANREAKRGLAELAHWQGNRGDALARYEALVAESQDTDAARRVEAIKSELLVSPQAAVGQGLAGLRLPYRDYAKIGYGHYSYTKGIANERDLLFEVSKPVGDQTLVMRVEPINRFGQHDTPVSGELYSPLWARAWGYVAAQGTINPHFAPNYAVVGDLHQGLGGVHPLLAPIEVSFGYRRLNYKRDNIDLLLPAVTVFLPFNLWITEKLFIVPDTGAITLASQVTWRPSERVQFFASGSFGTSGERIVATQDVTRVSSRTYQGGVILPIHEQFSVEASGYYEDRDTLYVRRGGSFNLIYHW